MTQLAQAAAQYRVWAEVDLDALVHNYNAVRALAPKSAVMPVIKADAYGHGAVAVARALFHAGARFFAVTTVDEALELREHGIEGRIMLLGGAPAEAVKKLCGKDIVLTVHSLETAREYSRVFSGETVPVHVKLDTGMRRIGVDAVGDAQDAARTMLEIAALPGISVEGVFTHFASADDPAEAAFTHTQTAVFERAVNAYIGAGGRPPARHCANSAGVISQPEAHFDMVRPGILLYGYEPCPVGPEAVLKPVMSLRAAITQITRVQAGESVGYGRTWTASGERLIATVSAGYADGLMRLLSGRTDMLVRGRRAPQVGRICMDMCMLDVTQIPGAQPGDVVTVFGSDGEAAITARELADTLGTIPYEILCAVSKRVPRIYTGSSEQSA